MNNIMSDLKGGCAVIIATGLLCYGLLWSNWLAGKETEARIEQGKKEVKEGGWQSRGVGTGEREEGGRREKEQIKILFMVVQLINSDKIQA